MKRTLIIAFAILISVVFLAQDAMAHGGSFRGPNGGVPPGLREPSDPEPPPPPPSDPGAPGGPTTPGDGPSPTTPDTVGDPNAPGGNPPPAPIGPTAPNGAKKGPKTASLTFESWRFWWAYNSDDILNVKASIYGTGVSTHSPLFFSSKDDENNRRNPQRATQAAITSQIIPALKRRLDNPRDHEDIHGGALVALGKIGTSEFIPMFSDSLWNKYKTSRGIKIDFGYQATESGCLALGLLPDLDDQSKAAVRKIMLEAIESEDLRTRERTWASVCLGLQRDVEALPNLFALLEKKYKNENIPAGIIAGIGLIGPDSQKPEESEQYRKLLEEGLLGAKLGRQRISARLQSFCGYALAKWGDPDALGTVIKCLKSRSFGVIVKRSAAIAAGVLGAKASPEMKDKTVQRLLSFVRKTGDPSSQNFATIALSQIGTQKAIKALMDYCVDGKYGQRPFAGLGLATMVFYSDLAAKKGGEGLDPKTRADIVALLAKLSRKFKPKDLKAAFYLARGICRDKTAIDELVMIAGKKSGDPMLRSFSCVSLGLIGDARDEVKDALKLSLKERKSTELRTAAATALGLLNDASVMKLLLEELKAAKSFAVQGQLIQAIGKVGDHSAITPLVEILDDEKKPAQTRAMAAVGLGMIGDLRELPALSRLAKNYNYRASVRDLDELLFIL